VASKARILVATSSKARAQAFAKALSFIQRGIDAAVGGSIPDDLSPYRLLVCELGAKQSALDPLLENLRPDAHVIVIVPDLDVPQMAALMQDERVCHLIAKSADVSLLQAIVDKLETGSIFGMERYLPPAANLHYRRVSTYQDRLSAIDDFENYMRRKRLRAGVRRSALQVCEELLMNAMYQAPVDADGVRLFAEISLKDTNAATRLAAL
jgi:hypothetical protein